MPRHKHADVIIAWANGEEIELLIGDEWCEIANPSFDATLNWRIKPSKVKKEGWVNVYASSLHHALVSSKVHKNKKEADENSGIHRKACIRIEWEEEV